MSPPAAHHSPSVHATARLLLPALLLVAACCSRQPTRKPRPPVGPSLTVMTFNVNFGLAGDPETLAAIERGKADVVFLQETTPAWERAIRSNARLKRRYSRMAFRHAGGAGGLAVLSRYPLRPAGVLASPTGWFPAWRVIIDTPLGPIQALQVHLRPPVSDGGSWVVGYFTTGDDRRREIERFARALQPNLPALLLGDFNEKRGAAVAYLRQRGLRSALQDFDPEATTWRWRTSLGTLTHTLDHIFYCADRLQPVSARVLRAGRSDHVPVVATFERAGPV